jgi:hypothetical protein
LGHGAKHDSRITSKTTAPATTGSRPEDNLAHAISKEDEAATRAAFTEANGNVTHAAALLGIPRTTMSTRLAKMARKGHAPGHFDHGVAPGFRMAKVTVQRGPEGTVERTWERQSPDDEARQAAMEAAYAAMAADLPRLDPFADPRRPCNASLLTVYTLTDAHIGMLAWHREGGADWDLGIAERTITGCFRQAVDSAPNSGTAILNQLGDLLHYDGLAAVTPTSGHILDADGRFTKMVEVAVRVLRRIIDMLLAKHERVHLVLAEGNHDMASSVWLRTMFKALYENEPRITVDDSALPYYAYVHGEVLLGFHHSHLKKNPGLPILFAAQFAKEWGGTRHRYIHTGNLHHVEEKEHCGAIVFQHPTLAARDAYAARGGWHAGRGMNAISYHDKHGEVGRITVRPEMIG